MCLLRCSVAVYCIVWVCFVSRHIVLHCAGVSPPDQLYGIAVLTFEELLRAGNKPPKHHEQQTTLNELSHLARKFRDSRNHEAIQTFGKKLRFVDVAEAPGPQQQWRHGSFLVGMASKEWALRGKQSLRHKLLPWRCAWHTRPNTINAVIGRACALALAEP